jgi:hypothetical protein
MMALPRAGEVIEAKREPDDMVMWSVTTILKILAKQDVLVPWAVGVTAERVVENMEVIRQRLFNEDTASAVDYIKGLRWQLGGKLSDTELGTVAHGLFEQYALSGTRPPVHAALHPKNAKDGALLVADDVRDLARMLDHFDRWLNCYQPQYLATEVVVYHPEMGYAGQADGFATVAGSDVIIDYKTSRRTWDTKGEVRAPYPENALQIAAYRWATKAAVWRARRYSNRGRRYYLLSAAERALALPVPEVEGGLVVKVTPDHLGVYPVQCGPRQHETFLFCQEVARWLFNEAGHMVGNPMDPPFPAPIPTDDPFAGLPRD